MPEPALTARVKSMQLANNGGLSDRAREALELARALKGGGSDEYKIPTMQSLDDFRGFAVFRSPLP